MLCLAHKILHTLTRGLTPENSLLPAPIDAPVSMVLKRKLTHVVRLTAWRCLAMASAGAGRGPATAPWTEDYRSNSGRVTQLDVNRGIRQPQARRHQR